MGGLFKPDTPDLNAAAVAQGEVNAEAVKAQTYANNMQQFTPFGSVGYTTDTTKDPVTGKSYTTYNQTTSLTPELQALLDKQTSLQNANADIAGALTDRLGNEYASGIDYSGITPRADVPWAQLTMPENIRGDLNFSGLPQIRGSNVSTRNGNVQTAVPTGDLPTVGNYDPGTTSDGFQNLSTQGLPDLGQYNFDLTDDKLVNSANLAGAPSMRNFTVGTEGLQRSLDYSGAPSVNDPNSTRDMATDSVFNQAMSRIDPRQESARQQAEITLRNRGLRPGDEAYDGQIESLLQAQTDERNQALWSAQQFGQSEAAQMFGQQMDRRNQATGEADRQGAFFNDASNNAFNQALSSADFMSGQDLAQRSQVAGERQFDASLNNQAAQQAYDQRIGQASFLSDQDRANRGMLFGERAEMANVNNQNAQNAFNQSLARSQFMTDRDLAARGMEFDQRLQNAQFRNNTVNDQFNRDFQVGNQAFDQSMQARAMGAAEQQAMFDAQNSAADTRFAQALAANNQNYNQMTSNTQMANALRNAEIAELQNIRGFNLNEINALMAGQQVGLPQMPSFVPSQAAEPAPIYQAAADQASVNAANNPFNAILGAAGSLGGAYIGTLG